VWSKLVKVWGLKSGKNVGSKIGQKMCGLAGEKSHVGSHPIQCYRGVL